MTRCSGRLSIVERQFAAVLSAIAFSISWVADVKLYAGSQSPMVFSLPSAPLTLYFHSLVPLSKSERMIS